MALYRGDTKLSGMGNGFQPENTGATGQVLKKTATGYNWGDITPPVTSVNSKTGAVTLTTDDISVANDKNYVSSTEKSTWNGKQSALVSGTNIKTINSNSILGSGNLEISGLPSGGTTGQVITKTTNGAVWADNPGITISGASFGSFINACKANGTKHTISVSAGGITYTVKGMGFIFVNYNVGHALSINGETVFSDSFSSGGYTYMYYAGPITVTAGDVISIWKPSSGGYFSATIYDWYDGTTPITNPGIYYNSSQQLVSMSADGVNWFSIADRDLGGSPDSRGSLYYWGNSGTENWEEEISSKPGYRCLTYADRSTMSTIFSALYGSTYDFRPLIHMTTTASQYSNTSDNTYYWLSKTGTNGVAYTCNLPSYSTSLPESANVGSDAYISGVSGYPSPVAHPVRPVKNVPVQPTLEWDILYQPS